MLPQTDPDSLRRSAEQAIQALTRAAEEGDEDAARALYRLGVIIVEALSPSGGFESICKLVRICDVWPSFYFTDWHATEYVQEQLKHVGLGQEPDSTWDQSRGMKS